MATSDGYLLKQVVFALLVSIISGCLIIDFLWKT